MGRPPFHPGDRIHDYVIAKEFIVGHLGAIYTIRGKDVLLKAPFLDAGKSFDKFRREVNVLKSLQHPNILGIDDCDLDSAVPWVVIVKSSEGTLRQEIESGPVPVLVAVRWMYQITQAVGYAHTQAEPILHRQIRPENIGFFRQKPIILDWGLTEFGSTSGIVFPTEADILYQAPELFDLRNKLDTRAETYTLGVIFYELLAGRLPFGDMESVFDEEERISIIERICDPQEPIPRITDLPKLLPRILQKTLHRSPASRYNNAASLANDIKIVYKEVLLTEASKAEEQGDLAKTLNLLEEALQVGLDEATYNNIKQRILLAQTSHLEQFLSQAKKFRHSLHNLLQILQIKLEPSIRKKIVEDCLGTSDDPKSWQSLQDDIEVLLKQLLQYFPKPPAFSIYHTEILPNSNHSHTLSHPISSETTVPKNLEDTTELKTSVPNSEKSETLTINQVFEGNLDKTEEEPLPVNSAIKEKIIDSVEETKKDETKKDMVIPSSAEETNTNIIPNNLYRQTSIAIAPTQMFVSPSVSESAPIEKGYSPKIIVDDIGSQDDDAPTLVLRSMDIDLTPPKNVNSDVEYDEMVVIDEPQGKTDEPVVKPNIVLPEGFSWLDHERIICEKDNSIMVYVSAGTFIMGSEAIHAFEVEKPEHEVYLDNFFMDVNLVTWKQYLQFCEETHHPIPESPEWGMPEDHPVVNIKWSDAQEYAAWLGKSIPTEAQWEKSARGGIWLDGDQQKRKRNPKPRRTYPWGDDSPNADGIWRANFNAEPRFGKNRGSKTTSPVGAFPNGASPYQIMDMAGNVWEWVSDWFSKDYYQRSPRHNPLGPDNPIVESDEDGDGYGKVLRGGSWYIGSRLLRVTARRKRPLEGQGVSCGMRCVLNI